MREIKFRCFYDGVMYDVKELSFSDGFVHVMIEMELDGLGKRMVSCDSEKVKAIQQFTGLNDKNGKEIYEGDVIASNFGTKFMIEWYQEDCRFAVIQTNRGVNPKLQGEYFTMFGAMSIEIEVIGNIYENPELLKP